MFIRTLDELETLGRIRFPVGNDMFRSARFLPAVDGMGYSYNENRAKKGTDLVVWLKHHWEANYIIAGKGEVTDLTSGERWPIEAGVLYVVGPNDRHRLLLTEDAHYVSIFCPPLRGDERNALIEAFNGRRRDECLNESWFTSLPHAQRLIEAWRVDYNTVRPHGRLGKLPPAVFAASALAMQRDGALRSTAGFAPRPVAPPSPTGSNEERTQAPPG